MEWLYLGTIGAAAAGNVADNAIFLSPILGRKILRVPLEGGTPQVLVDGYGAGSIAIAPPWVYFTARGRRGPNGLLRVALAGGPVELALERPGRVAGVCRTREHLAWIEQHDGIARVLMWDHRAAPRAMVDGTDALSLFMLDGTDNFALVAFQTAPTLARVWAGDGIVESISLASVATCACADARRTWFVDRDLDVFGLDHARAAVPRPFSAVPVVEQVVSMYTFECGLAVHGIATPEGAVRSDSVLLWLPFSGAAPEIIGRFTRPPLHTLAAVGDRLYATIGDDLVSTRIA